MSRKGKKARKRGKKTRRDSERKRRKRTLFLYLWSDGKRRAGDSWEFI